MTTDNPQMDHLIGRMDSDEVPYKTGHRTERVTDLEAFDRFAEQISVEVNAIAVGGFLPARQLQTEGARVTFFFGDDGDLQGVTAVVT